QVPAYQPVVAASVSFGESLANPPELLLERRGVTGLGVPREVALPLRGAPVQITKLDQDGAAIAHVHRRVGLDHQQPVYDLERRGPVLLADGDPLELSEHPHGDLGLRRRSDVRVRELDLAADGGRGEGAGVGAIETAGASAHAVRL